MPWPPFLRDITQNRATGSVNESLLFNDYRLTEILRRGDGKSRPLLG